MLELIKENEIATFRPKIDKKSELLMSNRDY